LEGNTKARNTWRERRSKNDEEEKEKKRKKRKNENLAPLIKGRLGTGRQKKSTT